jgi:hypothetical protein
MGAGKRKPEPKVAPSRPDVVPDAARWDAHEETWSSGERTRGSGRRSGAWTFYFADGAIAGHATYVDGVREGIVAWFHANKSGDLRERITYVAGKIHGTRVWQRTRKGKTTGFEWFDKLGDDTWRYEVAVINGTTQPRHFTCYGKLGMEEQVPKAADGRSIELGAHMDKLQPQTVLMLVEESFIDGDEEEVNAGSLARIARGAKAARGRWIYLGREAEADDVYKLRFVSDDAHEADGTPRSEEHFVDAAELSRAFTLSADYLVTARPIFDTPRNRDADADADADRGAG